jgi:hypothetical protein
MQSGELSARVTRGLERPEEKQVENDAPGTMGLRQLFLGYPLWFLVVYSVFILLATGIIAAKRHLWWDEIDASYIATLPTLRAIWQALVSGADWQTPTYYVPLHYLCTWFGPSNFVLRSIAVFPYWLATLVLYFTVARGTSPLYGFLAMLFPSLTDAFNYSFEARPYALVLLFTACTLLSWQLTKERRWRSLALPALSISLAAATCFHYNAFLIAVPLLVGEAVLAVRNWRLDLPVFLAICSAAVPVLFLLPHILAIRHFTGVFSADTTSDGLVTIYFILFSRLLVLTVLVSTALAIWFALPRAKNAGGPWPMNGVEASNIAAGATFLILPIAYFGLSFITHALYARYVLETVIGAAVFLAVGLHRQRRAVPHLAGFLLAIFVLGVGLFAAKRMRAIDEPGWGTFSAYSELFSNNTKAIYDSRDALLLGDGSYLVALRYGNEELLQRSYYPVANPPDRPPFSLANRRRALDRIIYKAQEAMRPGQVHVADYDSFKQQHRHFQMYDPDAWVLKQLVTDGDDVKVQAILEHGPLYSVVVR